MKIMIVCLLFVFLQACGSDSDDQVVDFSNSMQAKLEYSFPENYEKNVSVEPMIQLVFSSEINHQDLLDLVQLLDDNQDLVVSNIQVHASNSKLVTVQPLQPLDLGSSYVLDYSALMETLGRAGSSNYIVFTTADNIIQSSSNDDMPVDETPIDETPIDETPVDETPVDETPVDGDAIGYDASDFTIVEQFPRDDLPFLDFSTLHISFSQDIDPSTLAVENGFSFVKQGDVESVKGNLFVKGRFVSFDPDEDLEAGASYFLTLGDGIKSTRGLSFDASNYKSIEMVPANTYPHLNLVQKVQSEDAGSVSELNGLARNSVQLNSTLLGENLSYAEGVYHTELAYVDYFPDSMPFVIRKGSVLRLSPLEIKVGGEIPAGIETETIYLTLISDAVGYLVEPEQAQGDGTKQLSLMMDASIIAQNAIANGSLSQDIINITFNGNAKNENGALIVNAMGDVDVSVLGLEKAKGKATFYLEAYADQDNAPAKELDIQSPELQTWVPGTLTNRFAVTDPIVLIFNEALDTKNLADEIQIRKDGVQVVNVTIRQDGSRIIINPVDALEYNSHYEISLGAGLQDQSGNLVEKENVLRFTTHPSDLSRLAAPIVASAYPGINCRLTDTDLANDIAGRCSGGSSRDDLFNIFKLPENRDIEISFSQLINKDTLVLGTECGQGSFRVEKIDTDRNCLESVPGVLSFDQTTLSFKPTNAWEKGVLYQYTLHSDKESDCSGNDNVICSVNNLPLNPKLLKIKLHSLREGGHAFRMPFYGAPASSKILSSMIQKPIADTNRNFVFDGSETKIRKNSSKLTIAGTSGYIMRASVGCRYGDCEDDKYSYISGNLTADVGEYDAVNDRTPVTVYPQALMATSVAMYEKTILGWLENSTGPMIMRIRPDYIDGKSVPITGYIVRNPDTNRPMFEATLNIYLDAPGLAPKILGFEFNTNLHSLPLEVDVYGPVTFLDDGRMEIGLSNSKTIDIDATIKSILGDSLVYLKIPKGELSLNLVSKVIQ